MGGEGGEGGREGRERPAVLGHSAAQIRINRTLVVLSTVLTHPSSPALPCPVLSCPVLSHYLSVAAPT